MRRLAGSLSTRSPQSMFALSSLRRAQSTDAPPPATTFSQQHLLRRLPVPPLRQTLDTYLRSLVPLLQDRAPDRRKEGEDERAWVERELARRRRWADEFEVGVGRVWQERLIDLDRASPHNWLDDNFWTGAAYLSWRVPLPINSNWWCLFADDAGVPEAVRSSRPTGFTAWQIRRAASLASRFLDFRDRIEREDVPPDRSRAGPFDMHQYTRIFGVTRIPAKPEDRLLMRPDSRHIVVLVRDQPYSVEVKSADGATIDARELEAKLWAVVRDVEAAELDPPVGALTGLDRDTWTDAREYLLRLSAINRETCSAIEDALFVVALDDWTRSDAPSTPSSSRALLDGADASDAGLDLDARILNSSSGGPSAGRNRWFDKSIVLCVESNARAAVCGEHSPCDALIPAIVMDYVIASSSVGSVDAADHAATGWRRLRWTTDAHIESMIWRAEASVAALVQDSDAHQLWFDHFGVDWIRKQASLPPDAFIQLAMQLAFRQLHGHGCATYETASTRLFARGRTETIRTYSESTRAFCEAEVAGADDASLLELLRTACSTHNTATRDASLGKGCDRHLLGLRLIHRPREDGPVPALLADDLFAASADFCLSTSGLSAGDHFLGTGFGAPTPHGYGINYLAGAKVIKFGIESKRSSPRTDTDALRRVIARAMLRLRAICEAATPSVPAGAKL